MAGNDINLILSDDDSDDQFIQVPIKKKDFGDFITSLLGQPETINGRKYGAFTIDHAWLANLHHLIDQRINLQAKSTLVDFTATISYYDAPDRTITTAKGFIHFQETRITTTKSIILTWTYLVIFPGKPTPEKQEISVRFIADPSLRIPRPEAAFNRVDVRTGGLAIFTVSHTERTWGDDITGLIVREIDESFKLETFYDKHHGAIQLILALVSVAAGLFLPGYIEELIRHQQATNIFLNALPQGAPLSSLNIDDKLNLIVALLNPTNQLYAVGTGYKLLSLAGSLLIAFIILTAIDPSPKSHLLLTKKDYVQKEIYEKKERFKFIKALASLATALAIGVGGNYVYYLLHLPS